jgi:hypothetical protein
VTMTISMRSRLKYLEWNGSIENFCPRIMYIESLCLLFIKSWSHQWGSHLKQHTDGYGYRICLNETSLDEWLRIESWRWPWILE